MKQKGLKTHVLGEYTTDVVFVCRKCSQHGYNQMTSACDLYNEYCIKHNVKNIWSKVRKRVLSQYNFARQEGYKKLFWTYSGSIQKKTRHDPYSIPFYFTSSPAE